MKMRTWKCLCLAGIFVLENLLLLPLLEAKPPPPPRPVPKTVRDHRRKVRRSTRLPKYQKPAVIRPGVIRYKDLPPRPAKVIWHPYYRPVIRTTPITETVVVSTGVKVNEGLLNITATPPKSQVYMDGEFMGYAKEDGEALAPIALPTGKHKVEIICEGYRGVRFELDVVAGQESSVSVDLEKLED